MEWVLDRNEVFMAHILAIDDDPGILALIEHALRREGAYHYLHAACTGGSCGAPRRV